MHENGFWAEELASLVADHLSQQSRLALTSFRVGTDGVQGSQWLSDYVYDACRYQKCEFFQILLNVKFTTKNEGMLGCYGMKFRPR